MKDDNILVLLKSSSIVVGATVNTRLRPENEPTSVLRLPPRLPRLKLEPKPLSVLQRETIETFSGIYQKESICKNITGKDILER